MSTQMIGAGIGGAMGAPFGFGFAILGASIGGMIGLLIDPPDAPDAPELGDLGVNSYVHNAPVPLCYGKVKIYGGAIWLGDNSVEVEEEGSSKNPTYTTVYSADFALAFSEGELSETAIEEFLINEESMDDIDEDDDHISLEVNYYPGSATQNIDPIIQAFYDESDKSGYKPVPFRHTAYLVASGKIGVQNTVPTFAIIASCLLTIDEENDPDANPIRVLYDFMTNTRYGMGFDVDLFDGDPDEVGTTWYQATAYCDGLITFTDTEGTEWEEPRFRYSNVFDSRSKGYDIISDILQTCRGILFYDKGLLKVKIMTGEDVPIYYFSDWTEIEFTPSSSGGTRIYYDFSDYDDDYFNGDSIYYTVDDITYINYVADQTSTYIDLCESLSVVPTGTVRILKSNIKVGTFTYKRRGINDVCNVMRIEYVNRTDDWRWDVAEIEASSDGYWDNDYTNYDFASYREKTVRLSGVKRTSQAYRMASFFLDYNQNCLYSCEFEMDILGFMFTVGDVIGVSHSITKWNGKWFRIVKMEEGDDGNVKVSCEEYIPSVYSDITPIYTRTSSKKIHQYSRPPQVERFHVAQSYTDSVIYLFFKKPEFEYWLKANIYVKQGELGDYLWIMDTTYESPSVKLSAGITDIETIISFDSTTIEGTFPSSGYICIENEFIAYTGFDDELNRFTGCTRAQLSSTAAAHTDENYIYYFEDGITPELVRTGADSGIIHYIKAISFSSFGMSADSSLSPVEVITPIF